MTPTRRSLLGGLLAAPLALRAWPALAGGSDARLLVLILRGGLDGLAALPVPGDPHWARVRGELDAPEGRYDLGEGFSLCAELAPWGALWEAEELLFAHAVATPYRARSHFDGQDALESGLADPSGARDGWLYRALAAEGALSGALALGRRVPLVLRGEAQVPCVDPQGEAIEGEPLVDAVGEMWASDPLLGAALSQGVRGRSLAGGRGRRGRERGLAQEAQAVASVLTAAGGPQVATLELDGWDTHANQPSALGRRLSDLAEGVLTLKGAMGPAWDHTALVIVSEFGRTAAPNGTGGTDHGTGGVAFVAGGAVRGGRRVGGWPGLAPGALLDGRDLRPVLDTRALLAGLLREHLQLTEGAVQAAFPGLEQGVEGLV